MKKILLLLLLSMPVCLHAQIITTVAGNGTMGYTGNGGMATAAQCNEPWGVAVDNSGNFYIADELNNCVRKVNAAGIITTVAGTGANGFSGDGGPATDAQLAGVASVALDASGNLYISDNGNDRIRKVNTAGIITTIAGTGVCCGYSGDGGPATSAGLGSGSWGITVDGSGNILFADYNSGVIRKINTSGIISDIAGNGSGTYSGDGGPATAAGLVTPYAVAVDAAGNMYIADYGDNRVRKVNTAGIISTIAGNGYLSGSGSGGFSGDGGAATDAELAGPTGIAIDAAGNVLISDMQNHCVRKVTAAGIISTFAGSDMPGYSGDGGMATAATLFSAGGVALAASGDLYIADPLGERIRKVAHGGVSGVTNVPAKATISVFPNPATTSLTISLSRQPISQATDQLINNVAITNLLGQTVFNREYSVATVQVDVSTLPAGLYFVKVNGSEVRKFVKE